MERVAFRAVPCKWVKISVPENQGGQHWIACCSSTEFFDVLLLRATMGAVGDEHFVWRSGALLAGNAWDFVVYTRLAN